MIIQPMISIGPLIMILLLIAAYNVNMGLSFDGIEIDKKYYDISCKRIKNAIIEKEQDLFR